MFCPSFQTILNYPIQKTKTRQWLPGGGEQSHSHADVTGVAGLSWRTDSFAGCFPSTIKPSPANYNLMREDYEHFLKFGTSWHGELYCGGVRVPRKDKIPQLRSFPLAPFRGKSVAWTRMTLCGPCGCCDRGMPAYFPRASRECRDHGRLRMPGAYIFLIAFPFVINLVRRAVRRAQDLRSGCSGRDGANEGEVYVLDETAHRESDGPC